MHVLVLIVYTIVHHGCKRQLFCLFQIHGTARRFISIVDDPNSYCHDMFYNGKQETVLVLWTFADQWLLVKSTAGSSGRQPSGSLVKAMTVCCGHSLVTVDEKDEAGEAIFNFISHIISSFMKIMSSSGQWLIKNIDVHQCTYFIY